MKPTAPERIPFLSRRIDSEQLILTACVFIVLALFIIARDLILPLLRAMVPPPREAPIQITAEIKFTKENVLSAVDTPILRRMAAAAGLDADVDRDGLIEQILEIPVDRANDYRSEVPSPASRNRARGFL